MDPRTPIGRAAAGAAARIAALAVLVVAIVSFGAAPASAHTASGPRPTNYLTSLGSVSPRIPGVTVRVVELGNKLELTNHARADVVVLGYSGEPYLRVGPRGLYENRRSPATYLNRTRAGTVNLPAIAKGTHPSTPPSWRRISGSRTAIWHDHRIHWMGASLPPVVQHAPGAFHTIDPRWTVAFRFDAQTVLVHGRLEWVPGPSWWPWALLAGALFAAGIAAARRRPAAAIVAIVLLVGVDLAHTVCAEVARAGSGPAKIAQFFGDNFVSVIVWIVAGVTVWGLWRRRIEAVYGMLLVGAMVGLVSGVTDLSYWWKSQLPTIGPDWIARAEVSTVFGLGLGLAAGALIALRGSVPRLASARARDPQWLERLVAGLDDEEIAAESRRLDAGEVIPLALADAADRLAPVATELGAEALVFVVLAQDEIGTHVWSITAATAGARGLRVQRGRPAPARVELRMTFPAFLCLLAGTLTMERAIAAGRLDVDGDPAFVAAIESRLGAHGARLLPANQGR